MSYERIEVEPSSGALGAEVSGVDLARLDDACFEEIHRAWLEHQVLFFRDQRLTPAEQESLGQRFGELEPYPFLEPVPGHPNVIPIVKEPETKFNFGGGWHSDMSYTEKPVKATILHALDVPSRGGDTLYANCIAAYDALSDGMKELLDGVRAVFTAAKVHGDKGFYKDTDHPMERRRDLEKQEARFLHPVVRTHPETGRKALYLDLPHVERLEGMRVDESTPLMTFLAKHITQPQFTMRFTWKVGSLAVWDNRCVQHYALNDYAGERREMNRITVAGDAPF